MDMNIAKLLDKLGYRVIVYATDNGYVVEFPERKQEPLLHSSLVSMQYTEDGVYVQHNDADGNELHSTTYKCPPYAHRMFVNYYTIMMCVIIRYSLYYIKFMNDVDEEVLEHEFFHLIRSPYMSEDMEEKEAILGQILMPCIIHGFDNEYAQRAQANDVLEGFLAIQQALISDVDDQNE